MKSLFSQPLSWAGSNSENCSLVTSKRPIQKGRSIGTWPAGRSSAQPSCCPITNWPAGIRTSSRRMLADSGMTSAAVAPVAASTPSARRAGEGGALARRAGESGPCEGRIDCDSRLRSGRARSRRHLLGNLVLARVQLAHLGAPLRLVADEVADLVAADVGPVAVDRGVQVDPRDQPVPRLGVEPDVVVPFAEHLDQAGRVGVELPRPEQVHVALLAGVRTNRRRW